MPADCNARPCVSERKAAGARTMGNNGKTIRTTMETVGNAGACLHRCDAGRRRRCARGRCPTHDACLQVRERAWAHFPTAKHARCRDLALEKAKRARSGGAADARMSLCTYCHAPLAPGAQAGFNLSPLFRGASIMAGRRVRGASLGAINRWLRSGRLMSAVALIAHAGMTALEPGAGRGSGILLVDVFPR